MSVITWIVIIFMSLVTWIVVGTTTEAVSEPVEVASTPITMIPQDTGPLALDTGFATRLGRSQPDASVAFAATDSTLYRSDSSGDWSEVGVAPPPGEIVVADDPDILMTGAEEHCARGGGGAGVQISTDGGSSWSASMDERAIRPLAIWAGDTFAIGAWCGGILLSNDLGETWESPPNDLSLGFAVTAFAIVAGTAREVLVSLTGEGGTTTVYHLDLNDASPWDDLEPVFTYWGLGGLAGNGETFAIASITGVSISSDAGQTWTTERAGLEDLTAEFDPAIEGFPEGFDPTGLGLRSILIDDSGAPVAVGGESDIFVSEGGAWRHAIGHGEPTDWLMDSPDGESILAQAETGVWKVGFED
jgi:hypothetical protein